jgi:hypothetical protein
MSWLTPLSWTRSFRANDTYVQGCNDPNNSTTPEGGADIPDSTKCGACKPGWTRTADPAMMCWKVGYRVINCKTGEVYYGPKVYYQDSTGEWVTTGSAYKSFGDQVDIQHGSRKKTEKKITRQHPFISYKPTPGYSGATKGWHGKYVTREVSMIRSDGEPVFKYNNSKGYKTTLSSGGGNKNPDDLMETLKESCGGTMTWIPLTEEQAAQVAPLLATTQSSSGGGTAARSSTGGSSAIDVTVMDVPPGTTATDQLALQNQTTTTEPVYGCTDVNATNYDSTATDDDGTCEVPSSFNMGYVIGGVGLLVGVAMMMRSR